MSDTLTPRTYNGSKPIPGRWYSAGGPVGGVHASTHLAGHEDAINVLSYFNGTFLESFDALVTSDGVTITMTLEKSGGGDLTMNFSDGQEMLNCTPACSITLTPGLDSIPQKSFVFVLQSTKALTESLTGWPTEEHIRVSFSFLPSASLVNTGAPGNNFIFISQNINDHAADSITSQGHLSHIGAKIRSLGATWISGTEGVATQDGDDLWVSIAEGVILQMHPHIFAALDSDPGGANDMVLVINDPDAAFTMINSLNEITKLSDGSSIGNNKFVKFVLWGVANKTGEVSPMMINLPSGEYALQSLAEDDADQVASFAIASEFNTDSSTGFLVASFVCKHSTVSGMEILSTQDLRSQTPNTASAGGGGGGAGDVTAATTMTDNAVIRGDGGAKGVQDSGVLIDDSDNITGIGTLDASGLITGSSADFGEVEINQQTRTIETGTSDLTVRGADGEGDMLNLGRPLGDIVFGSSVDQWALPNTAEEFHFGTVAMPFGDGFFATGVRTMSKSTTVDFGAGPTQLQLQTEFSTEEYLGDGFIGTIQDDSAGTPGLWEVFVVAGIWGYKEITIAS